LRGWFEIAKGKRCAYEALFNFPVLRFKVYLVTYLPEIYGIFGTGETGY
jgi:hypothetical protein